MWSTFYKVGFFLELVIIIVLIGVIIVLSLRLEYYKSMNDPSVNSFSLIQNEDAMKLIKDTINSGPKLNIPNMVSNALFD